MTSPRMYFAESKKRRAKKFPSGDFAIFLVARGTTEMGLLKSLAFFEPENMWFSVTYCRSDLKGDALLQTTKISTSI